LLFKSWYIPKKKIYFTGAMLFLCILCAMVLNTEVKGNRQALSYGVANKIIVIDAGHGGKDPGAFRGEYIEKDITLAISKKLQEQLAQAGALVVMVREKDIDLAGESFKGTYGEVYRESVKKRIEIINSSGAELCISIHTNANVDTEWSGGQVFYNRSSKPSKTIAECIQQELTVILGNTNRKASTGDYYILNRTEMPAVIVEVGFISNPREAKNLSDPSYQAKVAYAIFSGIVKSQTVKTAD
jgi:N-acetylmuramoyl-L-alanine amidase